MPRHPLSAVASWRSLRRWLRLSSGALLAVASSLSASAHELAPCGLVPAIEVVVQRLNEARARGAICHRTGETMTAGPVRYNETLSAAATHQAREMAMLNQMRHRDAQDRSLAERLRLVDYRFGKAVENVAVGYATLDAVLGAWLASEGHCDNLMNAAVVEFGLACSETSIEGGPSGVRYWALVLGRPRSSR